MCSAGFAKKYIKLIVIGLVLLISFTSCIDTDEILDSLIGAESQAPKRDRVDEEEEVSEEVSTEQPYAAEEDFTVSTYNISSNVTGVAIQSYNGSSSYVKIPETVGGVPVLAIFSGAVSDRVDEEGVTTLAITDIIIPSTVVSIEKAAFGGCANLVNIELPFIGGTDGGNDFEYVFGEYGAPQSLLNVRAHGRVVPESAFEDCENLRSIVLTQADNVGNYAFKNCTMLEEIVLPQSVVAMGTGLFDGCVGIKSLSVPCLVEDFYASSIFGGTSYNDNMGVMPQTLQSLTVYMDGVVPSHAFYECDKLTELTIVGNVYAIEDFGFYRCKRLKTLKIISDEGFGGVNSLGESAFAHCSALGAIQLSADIASIPDWCFYSCASLRSIKFGDSLNKLPESVAAIGLSSFAYCESLVSLELSPALTAIPDDAFFGCSYLASVVIPKGVLTVGKNAFKGCGNMRTLSFESGSKVTQIGGSAFGYCTALESITLPQSVTTMGEQVFAHCWYLNDVTISNNITAIPNGTFFGCTSLKTVGYNENGITKIGERAFSGCESLERINLPVTVMAIGAHAFDECDSTAFNAIVDTYAYDWLLANGISSKNINQR